MIAGLTWVFGPHSTADCLYVSALSVHNIITQVPLAVCVCVCVWLCPCCEANV